MQLTNYSAIDLRPGSAKIMDDRGQMIRRIQTGERLVRTSDDPGAVAVASKLSVENRQRSAMRTNLQNARTYLEMQGIGLQKVHDVYERMSVLATRSLDVTLTDQDREDLDIEFQELTVDLDRILSEKFNGVRLFNQNVRCGGIQNIGLTDLIHLTSTGHVIRSQTFDAQAVSGTLNFEVNSGLNGEVYRVFQGTQEVFSSGDSFISGDPTQNYGGVDPLGNPYGAPPNAIVGQRWATSGDAASGDFDKFAVSFGPNKPTTYQVDFGASSASNPTLVAQEGLAGAGGIVNIQNAAGSSTQVTLQVESRTIYQIQNVTFEPESEDATVTLDENGATMTMTAKGFSTIAGHDIKTADNAQAVLNKILGDGTTVGEADCVLYERLGAVRAEATRLDLEISKLADDLVSGEAAQGRVADLDYAKEMTRFATNTMQLNVMTTSMATANRTTDVLMPLATQRFDSALTQRFQLI